MNARGEQAKTEPFIGELLARFAERTCNRPASAAGDWESGLTDFEWIDWWASLYGGELTNGFEIATTKH